MKIIGSIVLCFTAQAVLIGCSQLQGPTAIADSPTEGKPVYSHAQIVEPHRRMTRDQLARLAHIAPGNSTKAMRQFAGGLPYAFSGNTEWYPLDNDTTTWIGLEFSDDGAYKGFVFSLNNELQQ